MFRIANTNSLACSPIFFNSSKVKSFKAETKASNSLSLASGKISFSSDTLALI